LATNSLLFSTNPDLIETDKIDLEFKDKDGKSKQVKDFTASELLIHNIINRFLIIDKRKFLS